MRRAGTSCRTNTKGETRTLRVILIGFAITMTIVAFGLLAGLTGLLLAGTVLGIRLGLSTTALIRIAMLMRRRRSGETADGGTRAGLLSELAMLSGRLGRPPPALAIVRGDEVNAFAIAGGRGHAVLVTQALGASERDEQRAVLAHELGHLARGDAWLVGTWYVAPLALLSTLSVLALGDPTVEARFALFDELALVLPNLLFLVAVAMLLMNLSWQPRLERAADAFATRLMGESEPLIRVLMRQAELTSARALRTALLERAARMDGTA